jgi:hypothetical protein
MPRAAGRALALLPPGGSVKGEAPQINFLTIRDRQKAALVVMGVEQRELLMAVHRVAGIVDVERDRGRRAPVAFAEPIHQRRHQSGDLDLRRRILQPRHGRRRAQRIAALRRMAYRHLEDRIVPERNRDRRRPRSPPRSQTSAAEASPRAGARSAPPCAGPACTTQGAPPARASSRRRSAQAPPHPRELPAVEPDAQFLAGNRWKIERQESIFAHDGCGAPQSIRDSVSQPEP